MERIVFYKPYKNWFKVQMFVGAFFLIVGTVFLIHHVHSNNSDSRLLISGVIMLQGLLSFSSGYYQQKSKSFFIEWDDLEIRYQLLKDKSIQTIRIAEIRNVRINNMEVRFQLAETEKILLLEGIFYQDMKKVKEMLQILQTTVENRKPKD